MQRGKSVCFEYGIFKRELKQGRLSNELAPTIRAQMGDNIPVVMIAKCFQQNTRDEVRFLNGDGQVAGALASEVGAKQQNYIHQRKADMTVEVRRLVPDETDQLQGFPKGYTNPNGQADALRYRVDGNSWATPCARRVIKGVHKADEKAKGTRRKFKYGTISSGIEAHTVASRGLGDECVFLSEIDPGPISILKHYYPQVPVLGDMTLVDYDSEKKVIHNRPYEGYEEPDEKALGFKPYKTETPVEISAEHGEVSLVSGGTPCQAFSVAGKREGGAEGSGTRSALAFQLPRIGKAIGSDWIMWENVPGAFSSNGGRDILWFFYRCMEAGYTLAWRTFDAQYVRTDTHPRAVPQRRRRIFMVGYKGDDWRIAAQAVHEPISVLGTEPPERVVGKGFTTPNPNFGNVQQRSALEDFQLFMTHADKEIVSICKALGVCEDPETTLKKLKGEIKSKGKKKSAETDQLDMFAMLGCEEKPQGVDLHEKDLDLRFPNEGDIRKLGAATLYDWARTVSSGIGYCGPLFANKVGAELDASVDNLAEKALNNIGNAGILSNGIICTMNVPEWNAGVTVEELEELKEVTPELFALYDGTVCGLSDILELVTDPKYQLSWRACYGIIRRAKGRGKLLPIELGYALVARIIDQAPFVKWIVLHGKRGTTDENGELKPGEADIAEAAYQEVIESANHFVDCVEKDHKACGIPETDGSDDDGDISTEFIEGDESYNAMDLSDEAV